MATRSRTRGSLNPHLSTAIDILTILFFAGIGRHNHHEPLSGTFLTAIPFLLGFLAIRFVPFVKARPFSLISGVAIWASVLIMGHLLRLVFGGGTAWSFFIVSAIVLAFFLVGWRCVLLLLSKTVFKHKRWRLS
ncbi:DUF3054 domain-containing protein [Rothia sp. P6271]|uniref:DUF3054 domain-containing protein n=1 Tax=unclassified Rothia (in: high G+C Gram-positive bacteria) TaxID=2689056 RepID=UPI003AC7E73F